MSQNALLWRGLLTCLLAAACVTDVRARRIPNALAAAVLAVGLVRAAVPLVTGLAEPGVPTLGAALLGAALGLVAWMPLYALGVLGAGDVKLFAAAAAWLGPHALVPASTYAALAGGVLGLAWIGARVLRRPQLALAMPALVTQPGGAGDTRIPYALAITAGVLAVVWGGAR